MIDDTQSSKRQSRNSFNTGSVDQKLGEGFEGTVA